VLRAERFHSAGKRKKKKGGRTGEGRRQVFFNENGGPTPQPRPAIGTRGPPNQTRQGNADDRYRPASPLAGRPIFAPPKPWTGAEVRSIVRSRGLPQWPTGVVSPLGDGPSGWGGGPARRKSKKKKARTSHRAKHHPAKGTPLSSVRQATGAARGDVQFTAVRPPQKGILDPPIPIFFCLFPSKQAPPATATNERKRQGKGEASHAGQNVGARRRPGAHPSAAGKRKAPQNATVCKGAMGGPRGLAAAPRREGARVLICHPGGPSSSIGYTLRGSGFRARRTGRAAGTARGQDGGGPQRDGEATPWRPTRAAKTGSEVVPKAPTCLITQIRTPPPP